MWCFGLSRPKERYLNVLKSFQYHQYTGRVVKVEGVFFSVDFAIAPERKCQPIAADKEPVVKGRELPAGPRAGGV